MKKRCCTNEACPFNRNHESSSIPDSQKDVPMNNKGTQVTLDQDMTSVSSEKVAYPPTSEYDVFFDCAKEKHKHRKFPDNKRIEMNHVYQSMENPELFRDALKQVNRLTQQLIAYFEQPPQIALSKSKLIKDKNNSKHKAQKSPSSNKAVMPWLLPKKSSFETIQLHIPMELNLKSAHKQFKPRSFSKCINPLCTDIAKAAQLYTKAAGRSVPTQTKDTGTSSQEAIRESSSKYYSCLSTDAESQLPISGSKYNQGMLVPLFSDDFVPQCWCLLSNFSLDKNYIPPCQCSLKHTKEDLKPQLLGEGDVKSDKFSFDKLKESTENEMTCPLPAPSISKISVEDIDAKPCDSGTEKLASKEIEKPILEQDLKKPIPPPKPPRKVYRKVLPQHKDLDICIKCRFDPSPLMDEAGNVFCPGNCGCCLCPWKSRATQSVEDVLRHTKIKICKCRDRCTIFKDISKIDSACSQSSYFDVCPCREKAESKNIELYGIDMSKNILKGDPVFLSDVKELVPAKQETAEKPSEAYSNRNNQNISPRQNKNYPSKSSQTSQSQPTLYPEIYSYPTMTAKPESSPCLCVNCLHQPTSIHHTTTSSSHQKPSKPKCTCRRNNLSSSSITTSENFPIKLKLNANTRGGMPQNFSQLKQRTIIVPNIVPKPERLQPQTFQPNMPSDLFVSANSPTNTEEYFSCSSEGPDSDVCNDPVGTCPIPKKIQNFDKNLVILQLLHEVVHLMNEDNPQALPISLNKYMPSNSQAGQPSAEDPETEPTFGKCICDEDEQMPTNEILTPSENQRKKETKTQPSNPIPDAVDLICTCPKPTDVCPMHGPLENIKVEPNSIADDVVCTCPTRADVCPIHGPLENNIKVEPNPSIADDVVCTCPNHTDVCPIHGPLNNIKVEPNPSLADDVVCTCPTHTDVCPIHGPLNKIKVEPNPSIADDVVCTCPTRTDVCPIHGPLENIKVEPNPSIADDIICTCPTRTDVCPIHGPLGINIKVEPNPSIADDIICTCPTRADVCPVHGPLEKIIKIEPNLPVLDDVICICPKPTDICPKHGPLEKIFTVEPNPPTPEDVICICPKLTDVCPKHGPLENIFKVKPNQPVPDDVICICPKPTDVCPKHGPLEKIFTVEPNPPTSDDVICICPKPTDVCPKHGPLENILQVKPNQPVPDDDLCICPKPTDVCPKHGPLKNILKSDTELPVTDDVICICPKSTDICPKHGPLKNILRDDPNQEGEFPIHGGGKPYSTAEDKNGKDGGVEAYIKTEVYDSYEVEFSVIEIKPPSEVIILDDDQIKEESSQLVPFVEKIEEPLYIADTSPTTGRNVYNFLPEFVRTDEEDEGDESEEDDDHYDRYNPTEVDDNEDSYIIDYECEEFDIECELAKERQAELYKQKKRGMLNDRSPTPLQFIDTTLARMQQLDGEGSPAEMKFFIDSLILDLEAMDHARHKLAVEKNINAPRPGLCPRKSFPVTITDVTDLGTTSLYVKWIIHDCYGIDGYEIYTDGYLTNRYYNGQHESAVITNVDVTIPHKVALMAQPSAEDKSIEQMCNPEKNKCKCSRSIPWRPDVEMQKKSCPAPTSSLWIPSIYLYDPVSSNAAAAPPIMRECK